ncbi:unnamed protein product, partial [Iphiclides podalirius]
MENIQQVLKSQAALEKSFNQRLDEFEASLIGSPKEMNLKELSSDYINFKNFVCSTFTFLRQQINQLLANVDSIESRHRRKFLLIGGVPEEENKNVRELAVSVFTKNLGINNCTGQSLQVCHRRPRPILVKFEDSAVRREVWSKKTLLKGSPYMVSEYLTRMRQSLFLEARRLFGIRNVWTLDGVINVKLPGGSRAKVFSNNDLQELTAQHKAEVEPVTMLPVSGTSSKREGPKARSATSKRTISKKV